MTIRRGASKSVFSGSPASSAASRVNSLKVEPAWYPTMLPPPATSWLTVFGWFFWPGGFAATL